METLVLTVLTPLSVPIAGAVVTLHDPLDGALYGAKMTGNDGVATFDGTVPAKVVAYTVSKAGSWDRRGTVEVAESPDPENPTPTLLQAVLTPLERPGAPFVESCMVCGFVQDVAGQPTSTPIIVEIIGQESSAFVSGRMLRNEKRMVQVSPDTGAWQVELPQGAMVRIFLPSSMLDRRFRVPFQSELLITDLRRWLGEKQ